MADNRAIAVHKLDMELCMIKTHLAELYIYIYIYIQREREGEIDR